MLAIREPDIADRAAKILEHAREDLSDEVFVAVRPLLLHYYERYYEFFGGSSLSDRGTDDLYRAIISHWELTYRFKPGYPQVHVYNPTKKIDTQEYDFSIVDIVVDKMPFLVDSLSMELSRQGLAVYSVARGTFVIRNVHNIPHITPPSTIPSSDWGTPVEFIHFEVDRCRPDVLPKFENSLLAILRQVRAAVEDWQTITKRLIDTPREIGIRLSPAETKEVCSFLEWLTKENFIFLGQCDYTVSAAASDSLICENGTRAGIVKRSDVCFQKERTKPIALSAVSALFHERPIILSKASIRSMVHRSDYLDQVDVRLEDSHGNFKGIRRFVGLYSSSAYLTPSFEIPLVREKYSYAVKKALVEMPSHMENFRFLLNNWPKDELLQATEDQIYFGASRAALLTSAEAPTGLIVRRDIFGTFASCLVFLPRKRYGVVLRRVLSAILVDAFDGDSLEFTPLLDGKVARIHFKIHTSEGPLGNPNLHVLERHIVSVIGQTPFGSRRFLCAKPAHAPSETEQQLTAFWPSIEAAYETGGSLTGAVTGVVDGMLILDVAGFSLIVDGSALAGENETTALQSVGKDLTFYVVKIDETRPWFFLSECIDDTSANGLVLHPDPDSNSEAADAFAGEGPTIEILSRSHDKPLATLAPEERIRGIVNADITRPIDIVLRTRSSDSLDAFIDQIESIEPFKVEIPWRDKGATLRGGTIGTMGIFGSGAIRSIGEFSDVSDTGLIIEIKSGFDLIDPDADQSEYSFMEQLEFCVTLIGVEIENEHKH